MTSATIFPLPTDSQERIADAAQPSGWDFENLMKLPPTVVVRFAMRGRESSVLRELQAAAGAAQDPEIRARAHFTAGQIREALSDWASACICYQGALASSPKDRDIGYYAHNNLGYCLNRLGRYAEAERSCRQAIGIDPDRFNAHKNLGIAFEGLGDPLAAALSYYTAARAERHDHRAARRARILLTQHPEIAASRPDVFEGLKEILGLEHSPAAVDAEEIQDHLKRVLAGITVTEPRTTNGFQVFGLRWEVPRHRDYRTLDEALTDQALEITEVSEAGVVSTIRVKNLSDVPVFLMAGEQLVGAKQNRVLNASIFLDANADFPLPVSCVERGRWAGRSQKFSSSGTLSHGTLRQLMAHHFIASYRSHGSPISNQGVVWQEVSRVLVASRTESPSDALHDVYEKQTDRLDRLCQSLTPEAQWCGAVFTANSVFLGLDLFDRSTTLTKLWPKLIRAYALDAPDHEHSRPLGRQDVENWVRSAALGVMDTYDSPGSGRDVRFEGSSFVGAALVVDETPVHVEMFFDDLM